MAGLRSKAMPHIGHAPGRSLATPSHIGQKYFAAVDACVVSALPGLDDAPWLQQVPSFFGVGWEFMRVLYGTLERYGKLKK